MSRNFIQSAIQHPGALHRQMGVPAGRHIPAGRLAQASHAPGKLGQRARFAELLAQLRKSRHGGHPMAKRSGGASRTRNYGHHKPGGNHFPGGGVLD